MLKPPTSPFPSDRPTKRQIDHRVSHPLLSRWSNEKTHAIIARITEEKNFGSLEEANEFLRQNIAGSPVPDLPPRNPREEAQYLIYDACDEPSREKRVEMARRALNIDPDCADAYALLASEKEATLAERKALYEKGLSAAEQTIGPEALRENMGHFWGSLETRPYMRNRLGLAECLWFLGARDEAIGHLREMLRLNPGDNQGVRYPLLSHLLELGRDRDARDLIDRFDRDIAAPWLYGKALLKFMREGSNDKTDARLGRAIEYNPFVPPFVLGMVRMAKRLEPDSRIGDVYEAEEYASYSLKAWRRVPGALEWMFKIYVKRGLPLPLPDQADASASEAPIFRSLNLIPEPLRRAAREESMKIAAEPIPELGKDWKGAWKPD